jgi:eukaryotic-like serine/threonine-protein kinase
LGILPGVRLFRLFRRPPSNPFEDLPDEAGATPALPPGTEAFGPFLLIERLGEGGMAEVFAAVRRHPRSGPVVVKRLRAELATDPRAIAHFQAEGELGATLFHPGIVGIHAQGQADGRQYLAAEYVAGRDVGALTRRMVSRKQRPLSAAAILHIADQVLAALEYAHSRRAADGSWLGLVHRDITPENILISRTGEAKLLDFGIAQSGRLRVGPIGSPGLGADAASAGHAVTGEVTGNLDFMSPEQARGLTVDGRSDLFSLGLVLYFCAARAPLYRRKGLYERLLLSASGPGADEHAFVAGLCPPLPDLLPKLLAVDPAARFQAAHELRLAIARHTAGGQAELAATMQQVFGDELDAEQAKLTSLARSVLTTG